MKLIIEHRDMRIEVSPDTRASYNETAILLADVEQLIRKGMPELQAGARAVVTVRHKHGGPNAPKVCCNEFARRVFDDATMAGHGGEVFVLEEQEWHLHDDNDRCLFSVRYCPFCGSSVRVEQVRSEELHVRVETPALKRGR